MIENNPADAKRLSALAELQLKPVHGVFLQKMRAAYFVQLLVDLAGPTASSLKTLWEALQKTQVVDSLRLLDNCCMSGPATFCSAWSTALKFVAATGQFDIAAVLSEVDIQPFTQEGVKLIGDKKSASKTGEEPDAEDENPTTLQSVEELLKYGTGGRVPPADVLEALRLEIQKQVMQRARLLGF